MKVSKAVIAMLALTLTGPAVAQERDRTETERQLRELRQQVQELQRQLREMEDRRSPMIVTPRGQGGGGGSGSGFGWGRGNVFDRGGNVFSSNIWGCSGLLLFDRQARLGVTVRTEREAATDSIGAAVECVTEDGPAYKAGIRAEDIITRFDGEALKGRYAPAGDDESEPGRKLVDLARKLDDGDTVRVEYRRGGDTKTTTIVARQLESPFGGRAFTYGFKSDSSPFVFRLNPGDGSIFPDGDRMRTMILSYSDSWLDIETVTLNPDLGEYFGTTNGLLVLRSPRDSALSLKSGDVILSVDGREINTTSQLMRALRSYDAGDAIKVDVMRQKRRITLSGKIPDAHTGNVRLKSRGERGLFWQN